MIPHCSSDLKAVYIFIVKCFMKLVLEPSSSIFFFLISFGCPESLLLCRISLAVACGPLRVAVCGLLTAAASLFQSTALGAWAQ